MDDDAELAALRRRAYGPHADISGDPAAVSRLSELEHRVGARTWRNRTVAPEDAGPHRQPPRPYTPSQDGPPSASDADSSSAAISRPGWHTAMVGAVAAVALLVGAAAATGAGQSPIAVASPAPTSTPPPVPPAFAFASYPASDVLVHIPLDGAAANLLDLPVTVDGPPFATDQGLRWTQALGEYYGWTLWIARQEGEGGCILITGRTTVSRCVSADDQARGALFVSIPYSQVREAERPAGMTAEQSLGFWWIPGGTVLVLTGRTVDAS